MVRIVLALALAAALAGCGSSGHSHGRSVVAAFYPVAWAAQQIGGRTVHVHNLTPAGAEPHDIELTPKEVAEIQSAKFVFYLSHDFQPSVADAVRDARGTTFDVLQRQTLSAGVGDESGNTRVGYSAMTLAGFRGQEQLANQLISAASSEEGARGRGRIVTFGSYAKAVLYNGLARYEAACAAAREVFDYDILGYQTLVVGELAEAALHSDDLPRVQQAAEWLAERVKATPTA